MTKYKARIEIEVDALSIEEAADIIIMTLDQIKTGKGHVTVEDKGNSVGQNF